MAKGDVGLRQEGTLGLLDFPRDVTAQTRETAYSAYNELARAKTKIVGFNFSATDYMNSAGIGLVINLVEDATQAGRKVYAYGLGSHYRKLFNMVGLTERITLVADENEVKQKAAAEKTATTEISSTGEIPKANGTGEVPKVGSTGEMPKAASAGEAPKTGSTGEVAKPGGPGELSKPG